VLFLSSFLGQRGDLLILHVFEKSKQRRIFSFLFARILPFSKKRNFLFFVVFFFLLFLEISPVVEISDKNLFFLLWNHSGAARLSSWVSSLPCFFLQICGAVRKERLGDGDSVVYSLHLSTKGRSWWESRFYYCMERKQGRLRNTR